MRLTAEQLYPLEVDVGRVISSCTLLNLFLMRKRLSCSRAASVQPDLLRRPPEAKKACLVARPKRPGYAGLLRVDAKITLFADSL
jgi:hypothetical protein